MSRCLEIGSHAVGTARPNPAVGAVVVCEGKIIGEGYTSPYGGPHAEVNAINSVKEKSLLLKSTLYVTLEPCNHFGKTPPCCDLIIASKIPNVVIGCIDDNPIVAGKGIKKLQQAGCEVRLGILEKECKAHHKRFFTFHNKKRPYIILKWAQTKDGFIAPENKKEKKPVWITNSYSRQLVHKWRSEEQAILVGTNTVIQDNPSLTNRDWTGNNPIRIVLDKANSLSDTYAIFNSDSETVKLTSDIIDFSNEPIKHICEFIYSKNITSLIVEGGAKTLQLFIDENFWDEARVFFGNTNFVSGIKAPQFKGKLSSEIKIKDDILKIYYCD